jgi:hypothetical protein
MPNEAVLNCEKLLLAEVAGLKTVNVEPDAVIRASPEFTAAPAKYEEMNCSLTADVVVIPDGSDMVTAPLAEVVDPHSTSTLRCNVFPTWQNRPVSVPLPSVILTRVGVYDVQAALVFSGSHLVASQTSL